MRQEPNQNPELRTKFIVSESDFVKEQLESLIDRVREYCVLDETGAVHLRHRELAQWKQVGLVLVARFIGSKLDTRFTAVLSATDVAGYVGVGKAEAVARAKELVDRGFAIRAGRGQYRINPARIEDFLNTLGESRN